MHMPDTISSRDSSISVEAFLWHPYSVNYDVETCKYTYNDQLLASLDGDGDGGGGNSQSSSCCTEANSCLSIELPPRLAVHCHHHDDEQQQQGHPRHDYDLQVWVDLHCCMLPLCLL